MVLVIGEILVDVFPSYQRIGGAPFNFAYHLKHLGFPVKFVTRVGKDRRGRKIIDLLTRKGFDRNDIQTDLQRPTGTVRVAVDRNGVPDFTIRDDVAYDHLDLSPITESDLANSKMIYFGSLIQRTAFVQRQVEHLLGQEKLPFTRFFDLNLRPPHINSVAVEQSLHKTDFLKLNEDEMAFICRRFLDHKAKKDEPAPEIMQKFDISMLAITRGAEGSLFFDSRNNPVVQPAVKIDNMVDTVGAGDGFAAILAAGFLNRLPWQAALAQAALFSSRICSTPGAIPEDEKFYDDFLTATKGEVGDR